MSLFNNQHIKNDRNVDYLLKGLEINLKPPTTTTTTKGFFDVASNSTLLHQNHFLNLNKNLIFMVNNRQESK